MTAPCPENWRSIIMTRMTKKGCSTGLLNNSWNLNSKSSIPTLFKSESRWFIAVTLLPWRARTLCFYKKYALMVKSIIFSKGIVLNTVYSNNELLVLILGRLWESDKSNIHGLNKTLNSLLVASEISVSCFKEKLYNCQMACSLHNSRNMNN